MILLLGLYSLLTRPIAMAHPRLFPIQHDFHRTGIQCRCSACKSEATLQLTTVSRRTVHLQHPRGPWTRTLDFRARICVAHFVVQMASDAFLAAVLGLWVVANSTSDRKKKKNCLVYLYKNSIYLLILPNPISTSTLCTALAPDSPLTPTTIYRWLFRNRTRWQMAAVQLRTIGSNANPTAMRWLWITASPSPGFHCNATRLRASRPG